MAPALTEPRFGGVFLAVSVRRPSAIIPGFDNEVLARTLPRSSVQSEIEAPASATFGLIFGGPSSRRMHVQSCSKLCGRVAGGENCEGLPPKKSPGRSATMSNPSLWLPGCDRFDPCPHDRWRSGSARLRGTRCSGMRRALNGSAAHLWVYGEWYVGTAGAQQHRPAERRL